MRPTPSNAATRQTGYIPSYQAHQSELRRITLDIGYGSTPPSIDKHVFNAAQILEVYYSPAIEALTNCTNFHKVTITLELRIGIQTTAEQERSVTNSISEVMPGLVKNLHVDLTYANDMTRGRMKPTDLSTMAARIRQEAFENRESVRQTERLGRYWLSPRYGRLTEVKMRYCQHSG